MKTNLNMISFSTHESVQSVQSATSSASYVCGRCQCSLPAEAFYINKKTGCPGNYCKECRKAISRQQRDMDKSTLVSECRTAYPIITRMADPTQRKALILRALHTVAASIERKKRKQREADAECCE